MWGNEITFISSGRACALITLTLALSLSVSGPVTAQSTTAATTRATSNSGAKSGWTALTAAQQLALAPLAADWASLDSAHKNKWLAISNKFSSMKPEERRRIQNRMRTWVKLSPRQQKNARESYWRAKKIKASQKSARWQEYQQLPDELKKRLAAGGASNNRVVSLPKVRKNNNVFPADPKKTPIQSNQGANNDSSALIPSAQPDTN
ncbi:MAG: DUF3106 domain-containing protein [Glaciimonas sp.]|nr:DUF3106 domain-containing protein [Glaciimonas sp.]